MTDILEIFGNISDLEASDVEEIPDSTVRKPTHPQKFNRKKVNLEKILLKNQPVLASEVRVRQVIKKGHAPPSTPVTSHKETRLNTTANANYRPTRKIKLLKMGNISNSSSSFPMVFVPKKNKKMFCVPKDTPRYKLQVLRPPGFQGSVYHLEVVTPEGRTWWARIKTSPEERRLNIVKRK